MARRHGIEVLDAREHDDIAGSIRDLTGGRGPDGAIDAVGMEAHGSPFAKTAQQATGMLPDDAAESAMETVGVDRLDSLMNAIHTVRRSGTLSIIGVYGCRRPPVSRAVTSAGGTLPPGGTQAHIRAPLPTIVLAP